MCHNSHKCTHVSLVDENSVTKEASVKDINLQDTTSHRGADKSLAWPGRKQATATEDFDVHISYL